MKNLLFMIFTILVLMIYSNTLKDLVNFSLQSELYSHLVAIPFVSAYFIYLKRRDLFSHSGYSYGAGTSLIVCGSILYLIGWNQGRWLSRGDMLSLSILSAVVLWTGGFVFFYGARVLRISAFPFLFLLFMVPVPKAIMDGVITFLQKGSTEVTHALFVILGIPLVREGVTFNLAGICVEVAKECSGIRSSIALVIVGILSAVLYLKTPWKRILLVLSTVPLAILKNAVRIVTLSLLGLYVDTRWITGSNLHRRGGVAFFLFSLLLMFPLLLLLRRSERKARADEDQKQAGTGDACA